MPSTWIGRDVELGAFRDALVTARAGRGSAWALTGEAGIGKSEMAARVADLASDEGFAVAWGRGVEAGGAPPLWPWTEVLRALDLEGIDERTRKRLAPLVPELDEDDATASTASMAPAEARFRLLDTVVRVLMAHARARAHLVVVEDLAPSDPASIELLELAAGATRNAPLVVLATWRDVHEPNVRAIRRVSLGRFTRDELARHLGDPKRAWLEPVLAATEGHPFLTGEVLRGLERGELRVEDDSLVGVPSSVGATLRARLDRLSTEACEVVRAAAVLGRDVDPARVVSLLESSTDAVEAGLNEAAEAAILERTGSGWRFRHLLWRDAVLATCEAGLRRAWHRRAAALLRGLPDVGWSEVAHHLLAAGTSEGLADAAERAARACARRLAYDDAARWWQRAVEATEDDPTLASRLIALADATLRAGDLLRGRAIAARAATIARGLEDPALLARAALAYGAEIVAAEVDATLVSLLEEARAALGDSDPALAALVLARLASALQPAQDPNVPFALAREAIARARALGDEGVLLQTFRSANAALVDLAPPDERLALDREHASLAERRDDPVEAHRAWRRLHFDARELGDAALARGAIAQVVTLGDRLAIPHFRWFGHALVAVDRAHRGDFQEAERAHAEARRAVEAARSEAGELALAYQRALWKIRLGALDEAETELRHFAPSSEFGRDFVRLLVVSVYARRRLLHAAPPTRFAGTDELVERLISIGDRSALHLFAELAFASDDAQLAARVEDAIRPFADWHASFGVYGMYVGGPMARDLALTAWTRGALDEAWVWLERAAESAEHAEARVEAAWIAFERARIAEALGRADASVWRSHAHGLARSLEIDALVAASRPLQPRSKSSEQPTATSTPTEPTVERPSNTSTGDAHGSDAHGSDAHTSDAHGSDARTWSLERDGEAWRVTHAGQSFWLADSKGLRWLARIVSSGGVELHVLDLASDLGVAAPGSSRSDAGEILDAEARHAYAARARALRERLGDAEDRADLGAVERAREELDALERELRAALGLGGRERRAGAAVEKARVNVQRRIKDALRRIAEHDPVLGKHLERSVRTGILCSYEPDGWSVGAS